MPISPLSRFVLVSATGLVLLFNTACTDAARAEAVTRDRAWATQRMNSTESAETRSYRGRNYLLYTPSSVTGKEKAPLLIVLHGGMGNAAYMEKRLGMDAVAEKLGFMVAYLNGNEGRRRATRNFRSWNAGGGCCGPAAEENADDVDY